jgi:hypothetical protein
MSATPFDVTPEEALEAIRTHRGTVLVDLDETLYLRNSTQDFIGSAWPGPLAFLLVKILDVLAPWRLSGGAQTRDVWCVAVILALMPWSLWAWRRKALQLGRDAVNSRLIESLAACQQPKAIVTLGFRQIVEPLVAAMGLQDTRLVAMSPWRFRDRREGKRAMVVTAVGEAEVCNALLVTDSADDLDLLETCMRPLRVLWPEARYRDAFHDTYIPGLYISRVKRPGMNYIYRGIISDEFALWVLASITLVTQPILHVVGLALLAVSFWAVYESGYVDNDRIGARHEADPTLTRQFFESPVRTSAVLPWVWSAICGAAALILLRWPLAPVPWDYAAWTALLLLTFLWFRLYNRVDKRTRIWLFAGLQLLRAVSFAAVVAVTMVGMVALLAHVLARWVPYYSFRFTGSEWNNAEVGTSRLLFFILILAGLALVVGWQPFWTWSTPVLVLWLAFKARRELVQSYRQAHLITRHTPTRDSEVSRESRASPSQ